MNAGARIRLAQAFLIVVACCFAAHAGAANGSGTFKSTDTFAGSTPFEFKVVDAYAYRDKASFDATRQATVVVLADRPIDAAAITHAADRESAIDEAMSSAKASYVTVKIEDGQDFNKSPTLYVYTNGKQMGAVAGKFTLTLSAHDVKRIEGRCVSDAGVKGYSVDMNFALPVVAAKP